jgi:hypothetical protein
MIRKIRTAGSAILVAASTCAQGWTETFEVGSKGTYVAGDVVCVMGSWHLADGLIGSTTGDRYFGEQSVRLRTGWLEMNFDKTNGVEVFSAYFAKYGTDGDSAVVVECSTDGGDTWFQVGDSVAVTSTVLSWVSVPVHTNGPVRFRISKEGANRVNIDNLSISDYASGSAPPVIDPLAEQSVRVGESLTFALTIRATDGDPVTETNVTASAGVTGAWGLTNGVFTYTPLDEDVGERLFTFTACDKDGVSSPVEVAATVRQAQVVAVRMSSVPGRYAQNFDALATEGMANEWDNAAQPLPAWYAFANAAAVESYRTGTGSGTSGGLYAFGVEGSTNRSLGALASSGMTYRYGVAFTNDTESAFTNMAVRFVAWQWRVANAATNTLAFEYCVTNRVLPLSQGLWTTVSALCFDSPAVTNADQAVGAVEISAARCAVITEELLSGQVILLRWRDADDAGSDHAFGVDDFAVTWTGLLGQIGTVLFVR